MLFEYLHNMLMRVRHFVIEKEIKVESWQIIPILLKPHCVYNELGMKKIEERKRNLLIKNNFVYT